MQGGEYATPKGSGIFFTAPMTARDLSGVTSWAVIDRPYRNPCTALSERYWH
jgi:hypothetical protein